MRVQSKVFDTFMILCQNCLSALYSEVGCRLGGRHTWWRAPARPETCYQRKSFTFCDSNHRLRLGNNHSNKPWTSYLNLSTDVPCVVFSSRTFAEKPKLPTCKSVAKPVSVCVASLIVPKPFSVFCIRRECPFGGKRVVECRAHDTRHDESDEGGRSGGPSSGAGSGRVTSTPCCTTTAPTREEDRTSPSWTWTEPSIFSRNRKWSLRWEKWQPRRAFL